MKIKNFSLFASVFLSLLFSAPQSTAERGRVQIVNNNVVADNGSPLRGEAMFLTYADGSTTGNFKLFNLYDLNYWEKLRDDFNLNTIRLFIMRPPQNWGGGPGQDCFPDDPAAYRCFPLDYVLYDPGDPNRYPPPDTSVYTNLVLPDQIITAQDAIDHAVDIAGQLGMYIIIDYHPVLGFNEVDATQWWSQIGPRYKDRTHVIYELANEANGTASFEYNIYTLIRGGAPDTHIIMWSFPNLSSVLSKVNGANDLLNVNAYENGSVGYHVYGGYDSETIIALKNGYPVFHTEMGRDHLSITTAEEQKQISWIWLNGARMDAYGMGPSGLLPSQVFWPADPYYSQPVILPPTPPTNLTVE